MGMSLVSAVPAAEPFRLAALHIRMTLEQKGGVARGLGARWLGQVLLPGKSDGARRDCSLIKLGSPIWEAGEWRNKCVTA